MKRKTPKAVLARQNADPNVKKEKQKKAKKEIPKGVRVPGQSTLTIQKYDRELARAQGKKKKEDDDTDMRPGDFLFHFARFNLGPQALTRPICLQVREAMWQLYDADHDFWTPARIGTKFGFSIEVTTGIILMKAYEKYLERRHEKRLRKFYKQQEEERLRCIQEKRRFLPKKKPLCPLLSDDLELAMGQEFGWMTTEGVSPRPIGGFGLFSDIAMVGDTLDMGLLARASFKVAPPPYELPSKPPPIHIPARQISGPTRANKLYRSRLLILDIDKTRKGKEKKLPEDHKFMMIRELDGSLRTPSWKERINIQKHVTSTRSLPYHDIALNPLMYYNTRSHQPYKGKH